MQEDYEDLEEFLQVTMLKSATDYLSMNSALGLPIKHRPKVISVVRQSIYEKIKEEYNKTGNNYEHNLKVDDIKLTEWDDGGTVNINWDMTNVLYELSKMFPKKIRDRYWLMKFIDV